jgi:hypothetical protein
MREAGMSLRQIAQRVDHHHSLYLLSRATRSDFGLNNELSSTRPNSIDDVFGTIANGKLCVLVLVIISL